MWIGPFARVLGQKRACMISASQRNLERRLWTKPWRICLHLLPVFSSAFHLQAPGLCCLFPLFQLSLLLLLYWLPAIWLCSMQSTALLVTSLPKPRPCSVCYVTFYLSLTLVITFSCSNLSIIVKLLWLCPPHLVLLLCIWLHIQCFH